MTYKFGIKTALTDYEGKRVEYFYPYVSTSNIPMFDWDIPDEYHGDNSITFTSREEVIHMLGRFVSRNPSFYFRVYDTPGGLHGWLMSHSGTPRQCLKLMRALKVDPLYIKYCLGRGEFSCRLGKKYGREGDYIARYRRGIGGGAVIPLHKETVDYHDCMIAERR